MRDIKMDYAAVANPDPKNTQYKAIFEAQAQLLGFENTGETVEIKITPEDEHTITVPLYADPAA